MRYLRLTSGRRGRGACVLHLAGVLLAAAGPLAAAPRWEQVAGPSGGVMTALAQARSSPDVLWAGTAAAGLFRSTDGGAGWTAATGHGFPAASVVELAIDPRDARTVFAATVVDGQYSPEGLMRSRDGGATWSAVAPPWGLVLALAFDPRRKGVLYAATSYAETSGLYRTADAAGSWELVGFSGHTVTSVAIDTRGSAVVYVTASSEAGSGAADSIWKSSDRGQTWSRHTFLSSDLYGLTFDVARPGTLYCIASGSRVSRVLRSRDEGASWEDLPLNQEVKDFYLAGLESSPSGVLFAATPQGLIRSRDGGTTWLPPGETSPLDRLWRVIVSRQSPRILYAAGQAGLWVSFSGGAGWHPASQGISAQTVRSLALAPGEPPSVLAVLDSGVFRSLDRGGTWSRTHGGRAQRPDGALVVAGSAPERLYALDNPISPRVLMGSDNGGRTWRALQPPGQPFGYRGVIGALAVAPSAPDTLYVGVNPLNSQSEPFLQASRDRGETWASLSTPFDSISGLAVDPARSTTLYAAGGLGLAKSPDGGRTWSKTALEDVAVTALALDPVHSRSVYAGTAGQGVFHSRDGGATFEAMSCGLEGAGAVSALLIDPEDPAKLYMAVRAVRPSYSAGAGVWRWDAAARCWQRIVEGLPVRFFSGSIALDARRPAVLYAGTDGRGIYRLQLDVE